MVEENGMKYWHFAAMVDGKPVMRDGTPIEIGKRYILPEASMCRFGFHGSPTPLMALDYAPGAWVSRRGILVTDKQEDKVVGVECVHTVGADASDVLRKFGRMCALDVIDLWDAPPIVIKYLKTGNESIRAAAWDAAWDAARAAARDAAGDAARAAAWDAARAAQNKRLTRILNKLLGGAT